jgi:N-acetylglucosamine-6-phosphate deacetylase
MRVIDIHTHGIGGYDTRAISPDHILRIAEIHGSHGVSEIILTIYPSSVRTMRQNMEVVKRAMERQRNQVTFSLKRSQSCDNPPIPSLENGGKGGFEGEGQTGTDTPAKIIGLYLEGPFLNPSRCGSLDAKIFIEPSYRSFEELIEGYEDITKIIAVAPEMKGAVSLIRKLSDRGMIVTMGHSDATFAEAEAGFQAGARGITHIFNAMRGFHHREPGIVGFGLLNRDVYVEVIADPYHLHPETLKLIFRAKNHERIIIISDAVRGTGISSGKQGLTDSTGRLMGGCMTVTESSKRLVQMGFDADLIMGCVTRNPERYLAGK